MQTFTLEEAAAVIANQYGWHEGAQNWVYLGDRALVREGAVMREGAALPCD